jgi:D-alanyl-D-alanine carboxypeptidase (penicillin-binding protein 5/6)
LVCQGLNFFCRLAANRKLYSLCIKTRAQGSTDAARYCISATAERDGMELIAVVLESPTSTERFEDAKVLLNYGFAAYALQTVTPETPLPALPLVLGEKESVALRTDEAPVLLQKGQLSSLRQETQLPETVEAPVKEGDVLGTLTLYAGEEVAAELPIRAAETVEKLTFSTALLRFLRFALYAPAA